MSSKNFIFLHQPKTAGKSLELFWPRYVKRKFVRISRMFPEVSITDISNYSECLEHLSEAEKRNMKFIAGHLYYGIHHNLPLEYKYITMIRDPIHRLASYYAYSIQSPDSLLYSYLISNKITFSDFVNFGEREVSETGVTELRYMLENGQVKLIAGEPLDLNQQCKKALLDKAKENMRKDFVYVGATELFDISLIDMAKVVGIRRPICYLRYNESNASIKPAISEQDISVINERNMLDIQLHNEIYENLSKKYQQNKKYYNTRLRFLKFNNLFYRNYYKLKLETKRYFSRFPV